MRTLYNCMPQNILFIIKASNHNIGHRILDVLAACQLTLDEARHVLNLGIGGEILGVVCQVLEHHLLWGSVVERQGRLPIMTRINRARPRDELTRDIQLMNHLLCPNTFDNCKAKSCGGKGDREGMSMMRDMKQQKS